MKRSLILLSFLAPLFCACEEKITPDVVSNPKAVTFLSDIIGGTKATDYGFEAADNISVFAVKKSATNTNGTLGNSGTNYADNVKYSYSGGSFIAPTNPIYYPDDEMPLFFTAIYPYQSSVGPEFSFSVSKDQTGNNYTLSDLMTATTGATTDETPELKFSHRLSSVIINVSYSKKPAGTISAEFSNVIVKASADLNKRSFKASGSTKTTVVPADNGTDSYKVILPPQTISKGTQFFIINVDGTKLVWTPNEDIILRSGSQIEFNLTVNLKNEITFKALINPWNSSEDIEDVIEPEILKKMEEYIPINRGNNPPIVDGVYFVDPFETVYCEDEGNGGYAPGKIVNSKYIKLSNQNNKSLTVDYEDRNVSGTSYSSGKGSFICGSESKFSIYFDLEGYTKEIYTREALVISGEKTSEGIKNLYYAFVMLEKGDDPNEYLMKEGVFRVFKDGDSLAVNSTWPETTKAALTLEYKPGIYDNNK